MSPLHTRMQWAIRRSWSSVTEPSQTSPSYTSQEWETALYPDTLQAPTSCLYLMQCRPHLPRSSWQDYQSTSRTRKTRRIWLSHCVQSWIWWFKSRNKQPRTTPCTFCYKPLKRDSLRNRLTRIMEYHIHRSHLYSTDGVAVYKDRVIIPVTKTAWKRLTKVSQWCYPRPKHPYSGQASQQTFHTTGHRCCHRICADYFHNKGARVTAQRPCRELAIHIRNLRHSRRYHNRRGSWIHCHWGSDKKIPRRLGRPPHCVKSTCQLRKLSNVHSRIIHPTMAISTLIGSRKRCSRTETLFTLFARGPATCSPRQPPGRQRWNVDPSQRWRQGQGAKPVGSIPPSMGQLTEQTVPPILGSHARIRPCLPTEQKIPPPIHFPCGPRISGTYHSAWPSSGELPTSLIPLRSLTHSLQPQHLSLNGHRPAPLPDAALVGNVYWIVGLITKTKRPGGDSPSWARTYMGKDTHYYTITYMYAHAHTAHTNTSLLCALLMCIVNLLALLTYFYIWSNRGTNRSWILSNVRTIVMYIVSCDLRCVVLVIHVVRILKWPGSGPTRTFKNNQIE